MREKLRISDETSRQYLNRFERMLMQLTRHELNGHAEFLNDSAFRLDAPPFEGDFPLGLYELPRRSGEAHLYRMSHPLAAQVLKRAKNRVLSPAEIVFDYSEHEGKVSALEPWVGVMGNLKLSRVTIESLDQAEDYLIFAAATENGKPLEEEAARRLFSLPAHVTEELPGEIDNTQLEEILSRRQREIQEVISQRNAAFFEAEAEKLDGWADDLKLGLEHEIKEFDRQIKEARRVAAAALTLEEKLAGQKRIKALEVQRNTKRRALFDAQDEIDRQREELITQIEGKLQQSVSQTTLFSIRWRLA